MTSTVGRISKVFSVGKAIIFVLGGIIGFLIANAANIGVLFTSITGSPSVYQYYLKNFVCGGREFCSDGVKFIVTRRLSAESDSDYTQDLRLVEVVPGTTCDDLRDLSWREPFLGGFSNYTTYAVYSGAEIGVGVIGNQGSVPWNKYGLVITFARTGSNITGAEEAYVKINCS